MTINTKPITQKKDVKKNNKTKTKTVIHRVKSEPKLQEKSATVNGVVLPNEGYDGLSKVTVNVSGSGGKIHVIPGFPNEEAWISGHTAFLIADTIEVGKTYKCIVDMNYYLFEVRIDEYLEYDEVFSCTITEPGTSTSETFCFHPMYDSAFDLNV